MNFIERAVKALEQAHDAAQHGNPLTAQMVIEKAREREAQRVAGDGLEVAHTDPQQQTEPGAATPPTEPSARPLTRPLTSPTASSATKPLSRPVTRPLASSTIKPLTKPLPTSTTRPLPAADSDTDARPPASKPVAGDSLTQPTDSRAAQSVPATPALPAERSAHSSAAPLTSGNSAATRPGTDEPTPDGAPAEGADPALDPGNVDTYTGAVFRNHAERVRAAHVRALRAKIDQVEASVDEAPVSLPSGPVRAATVAQADALGSTLPAVPPARHRADDSVPVLSDPLPDPKPRAAAVDDAGAVANDDSNRQSLSDAGHVKNSGNVTAAESASTLAVDQATMLGAAGGRLKLKAIRATAYLDPNRREDPLREAFEPMADDLLGQVAAMGAANSMARRIMLTSVEPGSGCSLCALHLALSMVVDHNQSVIYVDADFDGRSLLPSIGVKTGPGVADWLDNQVREMDALVVPTELVGLKLIGAGSAGALARRRESLNRQSLNAFLLALSARYPEDLVILDAEPLTDTSSATMVAGLAGQVVIVVEADRTPRRRLEQSLGALQRHARVSVMLNKVR